MTASDSALAPVLGVRRDGQASANSSRALLTTLLGEFVLRHQGHAWTQTLTAALGLLGVQDKAARQALARLETKGWLSRERVGRQTRWSLTDVSTDLLVAGAERIYGFGRGDRTWNESWLLILAPDDRPDRATRHRLGVGLHWLGFGTLKNGTWVSPWTDTEHAAAELLDELGVDATLLRCQLGELGTPRNLAAHAWNLDEVRAHHERFLASCDGLETRAPGSGAGAATDLTWLVHEWRRLPLVDPELPAQLLPADWPAGLAAERFAAHREALLPAATRWWEATETSHAPQAG